MFIVMIRRPPRSTLSPSTTLFRSTAGVIATPTCALLGCTPNARWVAGGGGVAVMLNALLVAWASVPEVAVRDRKSVVLGKSGDLGGGRIFKKKKGAWPESVPPAGVMWMGRGG